MRNTIWKCGEVERLVVGYLRVQLTNFADAGLPVGEMLLHFNVNEKKEGGFLDAMKRLERRRIIRIEPCERAQSISPVLKTLPRLSSSRPQTVAEDERRDSKEN